MRYNAPPTRYGTILTWGRNDHGQLGLGMASMQEWSPKVVSPLFGDKLAGVRAISITAVAAGAAHSLVACCVQTDTHDHHMIVGWGANDKGQIGAPKTLLGCHELSAAVDDHQFDGDRPIRPILASALMHRKQAPQQLPHHPLPQRPSSFGSRSDAISSASGSNPWMPDDSASGTDDGAAGAARRSLRLAASGGGGGAAATPTDAKASGNADATVLQPSISCSYAFNHVGIQDVRGGSFHSAVLTTCGTLFCFGANDVSQCHSHAFLDADHPLVQSLTPPPSAVAARAQVSLKVLPVALPGPAKSVALGRHYTVAVVANDKNSAGSSPTYSFWSRSDAYVLATNMLCVVLNELPIDRCRVTNECVCCLMCCADTSKRTLR